MIKKKAKLISKIINDLGEVEENIYQGYMIEKDQYIFILNESEKQISRMSIESEGEKIIIIQTIGETFIKIQLGNEDKYFLNYGNLSLELELKKTNIEFNELTKHLEFDLLDNGKITSHHLIKIVMEEL